jgi:2-amino-4-hydroxy-6-hydroxymethyldihydropteridine diphosphokinase/dihydropteroate synthase
MSGDGLFKIDHVSPLYESEALLPTGAPANWDSSFLNLVVLGRSELEPRFFLEKVKEIEKKLGRIHKEHWAPRSIDIDILFWNEVKINSTDLTIPHSQISKRPFVVLPLNDLIPNFQEDLKSLAKRWKREAPLNTKRFKIPSVKLFGIINVTPDSFSDGGDRFETDKAVSKIHGLIEGGCEVVDIGAESTRPGAQLLSANEEWSRLEPLLKKASSLFPNLQISIDTRNPEVAKKALKHGVRYINDVSAFSNSNSLDHLKDAKCDLIFMHHLDIPPLPQHVLEQNCDPVETLLNWAQEKIRHFEKQGIVKDRLIFDPGIGFGKSPQHCFEIVSRMGEFRSLGLRTLVGHSRKSFIKQLRQSEPQDRDFETALLTCDLANSGVDYLRVHNGEANLRAINYAAGRNGVFI